MKNKLIALAGLVFLLITTIVVISSCDSSSHSSKCADLSKKHKLEQQYSKEHVPSLDKVSVYVENSGSMDGYVNGNTEFKTDLFNVLKLFEGEISGEVKKYFINDSIIEVELSDEKFSNGMSVELFKQMGGARETSNIAELISNVIKANKKGEVSVFISDCVFDPQSAPDIEKRLSQQKTTIQSAIKNKLRNDSEFAVVVYKLMSSFTGTYFNKEKPHRALSGDPRPYYMWFFGDAYQLAKVRELLSKDIESRPGAQIFVETNTISNIPYSCPAAKCNNARGKHIDDPAEKDGKFSFNVHFDLSTLPLNKDFTIKKDNYKIQKSAENYCVEAVKEYKKEGSIYTHEIKVSKTGGNIKDQTLVVIQLDRPGIPAWVKDSDDPEGTDYLNGNLPEKPRTFGLYPYISGVHDAYGDAPITMFEILIK